MIAPPCSASEAKHVHAIIEDARGVFFFKFRRPSQLPGLEKGNLRFHSLGFGWLYGELRSTPEVEAVDTL